jgi:hypothetical protein
MKKILKYYLQNTRVNGTGHYFRTASTKIAIFLGLLDKNNVAPFKTISE